jgi:hypothetical protein
MPSLVVIHPSLLPDGWKITRSNDTCNNIFKAWLSILVLSKTYLSGDNYITKL